MTNLTNYPAKIVPDFETFNPVSFEPEPDFENLYPVSFEPEPDTENAIRFRFLIRFRFPKYPVSGRIIPIRLKPSLRKTYDPFLVYL